MSVKNCLRTPCGLASRPHPWSSINRCPIDVCRKLQRMFLFREGQSGESFRSCLWLQELREAIRSQTLAGAGRIPPHDKHSHKIYINLGVGTLQMYQYIWHKAEFLLLGFLNLYFILPNLILPACTPSIFLTWCRTRNIVSSGWCTYHLSWQ